MAEEHPKPQFTRYVKHWAARRHTPAYQKLSLAQRGLLMELELLCKDQTDNGMVLLTDFGHLASCVGAGSAGSTRQILQGCIEGKWVSIVRNEPKILLLKITMYVAEQELSSKKARKRPPLKDQTRPDQNKTDQTTATAEIDLTPSGVDLPPSSPKHEESEP